MSVVGASGLAVASLSYAIIAVGIYHDAMRQKQGALNAVLMAALWLPLLTLASAIDLSNRVTR